MNMSNHVEAPAPENEYGPSNSVAIVGMGCRWPGGVSTPTQLWDMLAEERSGYQEFNDQRMHLPGFYHPNPQRPGSVPTRGAYLLQEDPKLFDYALFSVTPTETLTLDPSHRKLLEVVFEAFENAGEPWEKFSGSRTGVFVGNFTADHNLMQSRDSDNPLQYAITGGSNSILSNRINYLFNLRGPSLTLDTACSSSLYALHFAVNAIKNGDCDSAIVGAGNIILGPDLHLLLSKLGALSPTSTCHTFDSTADGYARGEGFAAFYLKKTSDAVAGSYPIRAVIRGTAVNSNGRTAGITHPSTESQEAVIREAYANANLEPRMTGYFEAHGTGTQVGDPIEVSAIGRVFSTETNVSILGIGSIKSNIGHTEAASGMAGLMKSVLALETGLIPSTININELNPRINFNEARVRPVTKLEPWPKDKLRRVSINSFGYGGANGHCILDDVSVALPDYFKGGTRKTLCSHPRNGFTDKFTPSCGQVNGANHQQTHDASTPSTKCSLEMPLDYRWRRSSSLVRGSHTSTRRLVLLPFSAHEPNALSGNMQAISSVINEYRLADLAYTLTARRSKFKNRTYRIVKPEKSFTSLDMKTPVPTIQVTAQRPNIGFIFTGQGAQWDGMGAHLFEYEVFRNSIEYQDLILSNLTNRPSWTLKDILSTNLPGKLHEPLISQTVCTALQIGLIDLLSSWKVQSVAAVGHSSGEIAAAYSAGFVTAAEAITIAYCRGLAVDTNKRSGLMLAVELGYGDIESYLDDFRLSVKVAAINSPQSVTISGDTDSVMELFETLRVKGVFSRFLQTGRNAYHSHHMAVVGQHYEEVLCKALKELRERDLLCLEDRYPQASWFSSTIPGMKTNKIPVSPSYWRQNLQSPVQFTRAVEDMLSSPAHRVDILVEVGPHSALKTPLHQIWSGMGRSASDFYFSTLRRQEDGLRNMLSLCGNLFCMDAAIDLTIVNAIDQVDEEGLRYLHGSVCVDLPKYSYCYGPVLYHENRFHREFRLRSHLCHDILGAKQLGCSKLRPSWRNMLRIKDIPWLSHHRLLQQTVFPASGYICMAIEAAAQFFSDENTTVMPVGFTIRNLSLISVMAIPDDDIGIEVILDLDASKLAISKKTSTWYTFKISSVASRTDTWTEHCSGIIIPHTAKYDSPTIPSVMDTRVLSNSGWYDKLSEVGLKYGASFQGLSEMKADPLKNVAQAKVQLQTTAALFNGPESPYFVHPASLDMCAQLALIAAHGGQVEQMSTAYVPSFVGEMTLWVPEVQDASYGIAVARGERHGLRGAHAQVQLRSSTGNVLVNIADIHCTAYSGGKRKKAVMGHPQTPYMRLIWKPCLENLSKQQARSMFPPTSASDSIKSTFEDIDRLGSLMVKEIACRYGSQLDKRKLPDHLHKFLTWATMAARRELTETGQDTLSSSSSPAQIIDELCSKLHDVVEIPISKRIFDNLHDILSGHKSGLELVRQDELHSKMYNAGFGISAAYVQLAHLIELLAHRNPHMNILEIGAGTGGASRVALKKLDAETYLRRYRAYTFTDVSSGYFLDAQTEFSKCHKLIFGVLDIEQDPSSQGFQPVYDLVIASCSLHVTRDVDLTLRNARSLLKPGGKLLILECTQPKITHGLVLGTLPDYWVGTGNSRTDSPFLPTNGWHERLLRTGFSGIEIDLSDYAQPYTMISAFLTTAIGHETSRVAREIPSSLPSQSVVSVISYLGPDSRSDIRAFQRRANELFSYSTYHFIDDFGYLPDDSRVIVFSGEGPWLINNRKRFEQIKKILTKSRSVLWISVQDEVNGSYPYHGVTDGLLRVLSAETSSIVYASVNLSKRDLESSELMEQIARLEDNLQRRSNDAVRDTEYRVLGGVIHLSRLIPDCEFNERWLESQTSSDPKFLPIEDQPPLGVSFQTPGILSSICFEEDKAFWKPLKDDQIEIRTVAVGLNWKDLAVSAGRLDLDNFSSECAGIVTKLGKSVRAFQVGDRVYGISKGKFGNYMRLYDTLTQHMQSDNFAEGATLPVVYMTVLYAFNYLAHLTKRDKVLIQSAAGGVGIAAIRFARHLKAEIFATVGTEAKRAFLRESYCIPDSHIFSSKTPPDVATVMKATQGSGFDVILSTTSGDVFNETLRYMASGGRFIDLGRVDVQNHGSMSLEAFRRNATFSSFDLGVLIEDKPEFCGRLLGQVNNMLRDGVIQPISPIRTFDVSQLAPALTYLSMGNHIGKVVITYEDSAAQVNMVPPTTKVLFNADSNYILAGGLGGLGRSILSWMIERGAKNFIILSRSSPETSEKNSFLADVISRGCCIKHICCDISDKIQVESAIAQASESGVVNGIVHTAVSLQDKIFDSLSFSEWERGLAVKVNGTINLHNASLHLPLDFFVLLSSISAQVALPTQSTYCASNGFQNEFARYRRSQGLPGTSVEFGLIEEVGELGQNTVYRNAALRNGLYHTSEFEFLQHLEYAFSKLNCQRHEREWARYDPFADAHLITSLDPSRLSQHEKAQRKEKTDQNDEPSSNPWWHLNARFSHIVQAMDNLDNLDGSLPATTNTPTESSKRSCSALLQLDPLIESGKLEDAVSSVTEVIVRRMADMLFISAAGIQSTKGIAEYGMDSLIAAELRNWFISTYKCTISFMKLLDSATSIGDLAEIVVKGRLETLSEKLGD
ncbi:polyketide synthase [Lindgomyces ingoldianus]|uniref:Polyketide synthase n=1 Tax=Lindgomyces ingoldianus TaxID=673940 RepID=A0ACB6R1K2_9PLEO|nr:polyketide synthase [Lindgomyces ingoldianus]KAF2473021.1 polyketide synthase [Lindgomyces ingoldianus]